MNKRLHSLATLHALLKEATEDPTRRMDLKPVLLGLRNEINRLYPGC
jgi:hypothetical protein